ncbi:MAG: L-threonylcarbamoyladenylate synthase [Spirochaetota bacterium]
MIPQRSRREPSHDELEAAARAIRTGRLVVFPTETVYGLGADALNAAAVRGIFAAKGRPVDNPLIVHLESATLLDTVAADAARVAHELFARFAPGPFTLVVRANDSVPREVTAGLATVAVRVPRHPVARALLAACGRPIAAPSANRSGEPSPTTVDMARRSLGSTVDVYLDGGACEVGVESTVAAIAEGAVTILRPGAVTAEQIAAALPGIDVGYADANAARGDASPSPGLRHRHYQPLATVIVCDPADARRCSVAVAHALRGDGGSAAVIGLAAAVDAALDAGPGVPAAGDALVLRASDPAEYARNLYRWFHELDAAGVTRIVALLPPAVGIGRAVRDRLTRAGERTRGNRCG